MNKLLQLERKILHTNDLAILWEITNRHNLYMTISRYIDRGVLHPIYKGLYSTVPIPALDPLELGAAIAHRYTYLTTETVLSRAGVITQSLFDITFVTNISRRIKVGQWSFRFRKLKDEHLYHPVGIEKQGQSFIASTERAVADMLYFNPKYHFDVLESINLERVRSIQKEIGYPC